MFRCYLTEPKCYLSDPSQPHNLCLQSDLPFSVCFSCKENQIDYIGKFYHCTTCKLDFHTDCYHLLPEIKHPFHISHPLTLTFSNLSFDTSYQKILPKCFSKTPKKEKGDYSICKCCLQRRERLYYHCSICNFNLNVTCSRNPPSLTITNPKSHVHPLTLFPIRIPLPCVACGLSLADSSDLVYTCIPCTYMIHKTCIDLPRVIKLTRHPAHRLSHTFSLPWSSGFSCGVCRQTGDINYGQYSCIKGCFYAVHSKCATREDVWDGIDLEDIPEEPEEDLKSYVKIDEKTIRHFSHSHILKLNGTCSKPKFCQACTTLIEEGGDFYSCMQCDFVLHKICAKLPLKLDHQLHQHRLNLLFEPSNVNPYESFSYVFVQGMFKCNGCTRGCCGFVYKCDEKGCEFLLDTRCASLPDPIFHKSHFQDHPLFFNLKKGICKSCPTPTYVKQPYFVECMPCKFFLDLNCATLPQVAYYKFDKHPLTLCYGEEETTNLQYWCEVCESKLDAKTWFYTCEFCQVTVHVTCLMEYNMYMKPNHIIKIFDEIIKIARNDGNSRPKCNACGHRCMQALVFKSQDRNFCDINCMSRLLFGENGKKNRRESEEGSKCLKYKIINNE